jgi:pimeloyl-ACP methyl ester carboxylesterase
MLEFRRVFPVLLGWCVGFWSVGFWGAGDAAVHAQVERLELGKRLQRFELAWQDSGPERQAASAGPMQEAVSSFFSLRLLRAAEKLDEAWWALSGAEPSQSQRAVGSHRVAPGSLIGDGLHDRLAVRLQPFYEAPADEVSGRVRFWLTPRSTALPISDRHETLPQIGPAVEADWAAAVAGVELDVQGLPEGDYWVQAEYTSPDETFRLLPSGWSRVAEFERRVAALKEAAATNQDGSPEREAWWRASLVDQARLLQAMAEGDVQEIDYPAYGLLRQGERMVEDSAGAAQAIRRWAGQGDVWLTLAEGRRKVPVRLRGPASPRDPGRAGAEAGQEADSGTVGGESAAETPLPVLILFHGAGGSENMFFETYGGGGAVAAGLERGWLVVATRQNLTGLSLDLAQILTALETIYPLDRSQVFLLGHSMGAGQVATQVGLHPQVPRAVAAIGGGGRPRRWEEAAAVPWFIAAGSLDFGKSGAVNLSRGLERAGGRAIVYREYPGVEHMVIVQAALEETFRFFDQQRQ